MGQKVNPIGLRVGYIRGWEASWFSPTKGFAEKLVEDDEIRKYIRTRVPNAGIAKVVIERTLKKIILTVHTAKPGIIIGKGGEEIDRLVEELKHMCKKEVHINIVEVKTPEQSAPLIGESIAHQLKARVSFRRAVKRAIDAAMRVGAKGIKIRVAGRLGGAEIARSEEYKQGRVPLHTLRADIDYAAVRGETIYGTIGIKVWIFKGEIYGKPTLVPGGIQQQGQSNAPAAPKRRTGGPGGRPTQR